MIEQKQENWALQQQLTSFFKIHRQNTNPLKREKKLLEYQTFQNLNDSSKKLEQKYLAIVSWPIISLVSLTKNSRSLSPPTIFSPLLSKIISLPFFYPVRLFIFLVLLICLKRFFFHFFVAFTVNSFVCLLCLSSSQTIPKLIHDMKSSCFVVAEKKKEMKSIFFLLFLTILYLLLMNLFADLSWFWRHKNKLILKNCLGTKREGVVKLSMCFFFYKYLTNYLFLIIHELKFWCCVLLLFTILWIYGVVR